MGRLQQVRAWLVGMPPRKLVGSIVVLAIAVRVVLAVVNHSWAFPSDYGHWEFGYEIGRIAGSLSGGNGFSYPLVPPRPTAWMPPVYPALLSGVFSVLGPFSDRSAIAVETVQVIASALSCVLLFALGKRLYGPTTGYLSALMLAFYAPSVYFAVQKIWPTCLFTLLLLLSLLLIWELTDRPRKGVSVALGLVLGIGVLTDPLLLTIIPPAALWMMLVWRRRGIRAWGHLVGVLVVFLAVLSPWLVRNYRVFGHLVLVKSNFGHELLLGNNQDSTGMLPPTVVGIEREYLHLDGFIPGVQIPEVEQQRLAGMNEVERNQVFLGKGLRAIAAHPFRFLRLTGVRIVRFWTVRGRPLSVAEYGSHIVYFSVLVLAMCGAFVAVRKRLPAAYLFLVLLFYPVPYYVTIVGLYRYRYPLEPVLILLAAVAVKRLGESVLSRVRGIAARPDGMATRAGA